MRVIIETEVTAVVLTEVFQQQRSAAFHHRCNEQDRKSGSRALR